MTCRHYYLTTTTKRGKAIRQCVWCGRTQDPLTNH